MLYFGKHISNPIVKSSKRHMWRVWRTGVSAQTMVELLGRRPINGLCHPTRGALSLTMGPLRPLPSSDRGPGSYHSLGMMRGLVIL